MTRYFAVIILLLGLASWLDGPVFACEGRTWGACSVPCLGAKPSGSDLKIVASASATQGQASVSMAAGETVSVFMWVQDIAGDRPNDPFCNLSGSLWGPSRFSLVAINISSGELLSHPELPMGLAASSRVWVDIDPPLEAPESPLVVEFVLQDLGVGAVQTSVGFAPSDLGFPATQLGCCCADPPEVGCSIIEAITSFDFSHVSVSIDPVSSHTHSWGQVRSRF